MTEDNAITTEEATRVLQHEHHEECRSLAREAHKESKARGEDIHDILHEMIDGHEWIIYTWKAQRVLWLSDNSDAMHEETGERGTWEQMAYFALVADVRSYLDAMDTDDEESEAT